MLHFQYPTKHRKQKVIFPFKMVDIVKTETKICNNLILVRGKNEASIWKQKRKVVWPQLKSMDLIVERFSQRMKEAIKFNIPNEKSLVAGTPVPKNILGSKSLLH